MTGGPFDDDLTPEQRAKVDGLLEWLAALMAARDEHLVAEMAEHIADEPPEVPDGHCVLYGTEGQVDHVWRVPDPKPDVLLAPIPLSMRELTRYDPDPSEAYSPLRTAEYQRIAEFTYQRRR